MAETEHITVARTSAGLGGPEDPGRSVEVPVVELLTGRGFVTGKSGSGKSNTASVIAEKLLDNGFGILIVDIDGEYYGLKEEYEILHAGADEECDIQVTVEHAEKLAGLALEQNVPIILDISSFLDVEEAEDLLTEVARHLFAKAKKQKQPYLMLVEECHEWIPENGSVGEVGRTLIKIGKRGRKHGLGMVGISQRPADVKKDYITQCDWLVWHRLTWNNDTKVVGRILDSEYADAVEDLDDGEAFLMTDWSESIRRVQFHRKRTFDAGATPGLEDFERPELKSVSDDLVAELTEISEEERRREDRVGELRDLLDDKNSRIAELERELRDARDMSRMAEQFTDALLDHVRGHNPGRTEQGKLRERRDRYEDERGATEPESEAPSAGDADGGDPADQTSGGGFGDAFGMFADDGPAMAGGDESADEGAESTASADQAETATLSEASAENGISDETDSAEASDSTNGDDAFAFAPMDFAAGTDADGENDGATDGDAPPGTDGASASLGRSEAGTENGVTTGTGPASVGNGTSVANGDAADAATAGAEATGSSSVVHRTVVDLVSDVRGLDRTTLRMLAYYLDQGADTPLNAHFSAGGTGDRTKAYARNRELRTAGFVEHVGRGRYDVRLRELVEETVPRGTRESRIDAAVAELRDVALSSRADA